MAGKKAAGAGRRAGSKAHFKWTAEKEETFFRELALVCNVKAALKAASMSGASRNVYDRRKRDPNFRAAWDEAIAESYAMLELEMLERGRLGENRPPPKTAAEARLREIPSGLAMNLLKHHHHRVKGQSAHAQRPMRGHRLRDELEKRLSEISRRLGGGG